VEAAAADWRDRRDTAAHLDFRAVNLLALRDRIVGVIDWSDARRASPESDLGQVDLSDLPQVLSGYEQSASRHVDLSIVAGYSLARYLALEVSEVLPAGSSKDAVEFWRRFEVRSG
jgi:aminoglycoside phosphotransferase (APT) family kinase protein